MGKNQGEGDRESAKRFDDEQRKFVESGKVDKEQHHRDLSEREKEEIRKAEEAAKSRAKE
jgi:hypothetical protein